MCKITSDPQKLIQRKTKSVKPDSTNSWPIYRMQKTNKTAKQKSIAPMIYWSKDPRHSFFFCQKSSSSIVEYVISSRWHDNASHQYKHCTVDGRDRHPPVRDFPSGELTKGTGRGGGGSTHPPISTAHGRLNEPRGLWCSF